MVNVGPLEPDDLPAIAGSVAQPPWLSLAERKAREYADKVRAEKQAQAKLLSEYEKFGQVQAMIATTTLFPLDNGDRTWDWCAGCDRVIEAHWMMWTPSYDYRCWTCARGIAIPVVKLFDGAPSAVPSHNRTSRHR